MTRMPEFESRLASKLQINKNVKAREEKKLASIFSFASHHSLKKKTFSMNFLSVHFCFCLCELGLCQSPREQYITRFSQRENLPLAFAPMNSSSVSLTHALTHTHVLTHTHTHTHTYSHTHTLFSCTQSTLLLPS